jgi:hypothetical protein
MARPTGFEPVTTPFLCWVMNAYFNAFPWQRRPSHSTTTPTLGYISPMGYEAAAVELRKAA